MNQDTNREDRIPIQRSARQVAWNCHRAKFLVCLGCGSVEDSDGEFDCPCAQTEAV